MRRTPLIPVAAAALSLLGTAFAPAAHAADAETVADGLVGPLSVAVAADGTAYVAQSFAGLLTEAVPGGDQTVIHDAEGQEVAGVSIEGDVVTFTTTNYDTGAAGVSTLGPGGVAQLASTSDYEASANPDAVNRYGLVNVTKNCRQKMPKGIRNALKPYNGHVESHPYATNVAGNGVTYVADAAANAIFAVTDAGAITTTAVLPPTKVAVTKKIRNSFHLPKCTKSGTIKLEPVPTDVEMGPDNNLYVTTLPGGPEDPSLGLNGAVYKVNPATGTVSKEIGGLLSPTGLAIAPNGTAYVASLFGGVIMQKPPSGEASVFAEVPFPGDVEVIDGYVYATETDLTNDGTSAPAGKVLRWSTAG